MYVQEVECSSLQKNILLLNIVSHRAYRRSYKRVHFQLHVKQIPSQKGSVFARNHDVPQNSVAWMKGNIYEWFLSHLLLTEEESGEKLNPSILLNPQTQILFKTLEFGSTSKVAWIPSHYRHLNVKSII